MTEQQACTLCGAGGHTAAQCSWNKADDAQMELHPDLKRVYDVIGLHYSNPVSILIANFENTKRFAELLHAIEREFFMVPGEPSDEPEDEGCEPDDVCLMSCWGSTQEQYIEQFREALAVIQARAALAQPSPAPALERPEVVARLYTDINGDIHASVHATAGEPLIRLADFDRIAGELREKADDAQRRDKEAYDRLHASYEALHEVIRRISKERDAAQARVAELERDRCDLRNKLASANLKESIREEQEPDHAAFLDWAEKVLSDEQERLSGGDYLMDSNDCIAALREAAAPVAQAGQVPEIQVCKIGTYGKAYDLPETKRAYTYAEQPDNLGASRLGAAATAAFAASAGDHIDRGLVLLRELQANGFGVFELPASPAQGGDA